jgi:hypothetical protein
VAPRQLTAGTNRVGPLAVAAGSSWGYEGGGGLLGVAGVVVAWVVLAVVAGAVRTTTISGLGGALLLPHPATQHAAAKGSARLTATPWMRLDRTTRSSRIQKVAAKRGVRNR